AREFVKLEIGVEAAAGLFVHDLVLEQGVGDTHDASAVHLALRRLQIDDEPAILHRNQFIDMDKAGFGIHADFRHLRAADAAGKQVIVSTLALADASDGSRSEEHTSELQSRFDLVCRLLLEKKKNR